MCVRGVKGIWAVDSPLQQSSWRCVVFQGKIRGRRVRPFYTAWFTLQHAAAILSHRWSVVVIANRNRHHGVQLSFATVISLAPNPFCFTKKQYYYRWLMMMMISGCVGGVGGGQDWLWYVRLRAVPIGADELTPGFQAVTLETTSSDPPKVSVTATQALIPIASADTACTCAVCDPICAPTSEAAISLLTSPVFVIPRMRLWCCVFRVRKQPSRFLAHS
jgi:hypothetical protein